jgi:hypothetical protein
MHYPFGVPLQGIPRSTPSKDPIEVPPGAPLRVPWGSLATHTRSTSGKRPARADVVCIGV